MTGAVVIEAVVQAGAHETRYLRCGRGEKVVVVLAMSEVERLRLMYPLAGTYRVIAPQPPVGGGVVGQTPAADPEGGTSGQDRERDAAGSDRDGVRRGQDREGDAAAVDTWLRGVLDGLGIERPALVLAPDLLWLTGRISCCEHLAGPGVVDHEAC